MSQVIESLNRRSRPNSLSRHTRILQFGEGNFLRAFADWIIQELNNKTTFNGSVKVVQPIPHGYGDKINEQDGLYHVVLKGYDGEQFRSSIQMIDVIEEAINPYQQFDTFLKEAENPKIEFIISNTTEAGIILNEEDSLTDKPASSFPGKLLQFLHRRYQTLPNSKPIYILPCELIDRNGNKLKKVIQTLSSLWKLGNYFDKWLEEKVIFCNTLVDRIVPGFPKEHASETWDELEVRDELLVEGELFHLWVIEGPKSLNERLPFNQTKLNVILTSDLEKYRERKVRILNGLHTAMVPVAYLLGMRTVKESIENELVNQFLNHVLYKEILPTIEGDPDELKAYSDEIFRRFKNPAIRHELISISLNSFSKFKTRILPSILDLHQAKGESPKLLLFALAALVRFYKGHWKDEQIELKDDSYVLDKVSNLWQSDKNIELIAMELLKDDKLWGMDLTSIPEVLSKTSDYLNMISIDGIEFSLKTILQSQLK